MKHPLAPFVLAAVASALSSPASADWVGLNDGQYQVTLSCVQSLTLDCSQTFVGTITVQGAGLSHLDLSIAGLDFDADPNEIDFSDATGSSQGAVVFLPIGAAASLSHVISGNVLGYAAGENFWSYCSDLPNTQSCLADTLGTWTAARIGRVDEPSALAAALLGLALAAATRQTRGRLNHVAS